MPTITAYIETSHFCLLLYKNKTEYDFFYSPYVYLPEVFSNYTNEEEFYTTIMELFCRKNGVDFTKCDIYVSGFVSVPEFKNNNIKRVEFTTLFDNMPNFYPVIVNDFAFVTKFFMVSETSFGFLKSNSGDTTFRVNKCIYPHLKAIDLSSQLSLDREVLFGVIANKLKWDPNTPVIFMGSRFYGEDERPLDYIYMFSLINTPGVYDIYLDRTHSFLLFNMLNTVMEADKIPLDLESIEHVGTLITGLGQVECLVTSENNSPFVFDVEKNTLRRTPLSDDTEYRLVVKNKDIGVVEKTVFGGRLGVIVDTREDKADAFSNIRKFDTYLKFLNN